VNERKPNIISITPASLHPKI